MAHRVLHASDAHWRPSNQMKVLNTDLAGQLESSALGARLWRIAPGQASTRHLHLEQEELYLLLEGAGRMRVDDQLLDLEPLDAVLVEPPSVRQLFNDTGEDQLWLVVGAPREKFASTLEMSEEVLRRMYPDGPPRAAARARGRRLGGRRLQGLERQAQALVQGGIGSPAELPLRPRGVDRDPLDLAFAWRRELRLE